MDLRWHACHRAAGPSSGSSAAQAHSVDVSNGALWHGYCALLIERMSPRVFRLVNGGDVAPVGARGLPRRRPDMRRLPSNRSAPGLDGFNPAAWSVVMTAAPVAR
jgi:hypothetical protein